MFTRRDKRHDPGAGPVLARDLRQELSDFRLKSTRRGLAIVAAVLGAVVVLGTVWMLGSIRPRMADLEAELEAVRSAERLALQDNAVMDLRIESLRQVLDYSARYRIPADLAQTIFEIALSEDLEPEMAFRLVQTESSFRRHAVSEAGAVGYTQILPSTARWLDPAVSDADLYDRGTNLRLGFRYLRLLLEENGGEMRLALLAYNRGPGTVRSIVARGGDPANGYAARIMGSE